MSPAAERAAPPVLGVTGGFGSGKSTVCQLLVDAHGLPLIDADRLGHDALHPGSTVYEALLARFGDDILDEGGAVRRAALAAKVFQDPSALAALNALVHPWILERIEARVLALKASGYAGIILLEAALLLDWTHRYRPRGILLVAAPLESRLDRLEARGFPRADAERRIRHQATDEAMREQVDWVLHNEGDLGALRGRLQRLWPEIEARLLAGPASGRA